MNGDDVILIMNKDSMNYKNINNPNARYELLGLIDSLDLVDVFRANKQKLKHFTCRIKNPNQTAQFDFSLMSETFLSISPNIEYENSHRSDHFQQTNVAKSMYLEKETISGNLTIFSLHVC